LIAYAISSIINEVERMVPKTDLYQIPHAILPCLPRVDIVPVSLAHGRDDGSLLLLTTISL
jgi:hypothetical protein